MYYFLNRQNDSESIQSVSLLGASLGCQVVNRSQTGKYVVRAEDLPRGSKLPFAQRPISQSVRRFARLSGSRSVPDWKVCSAR